MNRGTLSFSSDEKQNTVLQYYYYKRYMSTLNLVALTRPISYFFHFFSTTHLWLNLLTSVKQSGEPDRMVPLPSQAHHITYIVKFRFQLL